MLRIGFGLALLTMAPMASTGELEWVEDAAGRLVVRLELPPAATPNGVDWAAGLTAHVGRCDERDTTPPMLAGVEVEAERIWLRPRFELDPTGDYCAVLDRSRLTRSTATAELLLEQWSGSQRTGPQRTGPQWTGQVPAQAPHAVRILPAVDSLPANALRLYVEFSRSVFARDVHRWIRLRDDTRGVWVEEPFVNIPEGLWDGEQQRLTLVFHPGRIKRGVGPNLALGPPLEAGHRYRLLVEAPRGLPVSFEFTATREDRQAVDPGRWRLRPPETPTDPLRVEFDEPLDPYLVERWVWVEAAEGRIVETTAEARPDGLGLTLRPRRPWPRCALDLVVDSRLEDVAGNRVGQLFDRSLREGAFDRRDQTDAAPVRLRIQD